MDKSKVPRFFWPTLYFGPCECLLLTRPIAFARTLLF